jgi:hypothetical protein
MNCCISVESNKNGGYLRFEKKVEPDNINKYKKLNIFPLNYDHNINISFLLERKKRQTTKNYIV